MDRKSKSSGRASSSASSREALRRLKAGLFQALGNPTRIHIVECLSRGGGKPGRAERSVGELLEETGAGPANLSQHLNILRNKGLVASRKEGAQVFCRLQDPRIGKVLELMKAICEADLRQSLSFLEAADSAG